MIQSTSRGTMANAAPKPSQQAIKAKYTFDLSVSYNDNGELGATSRVERIHMVGMFICTLPLHLCLHVLCFRNFTCVILKA